MGLEKKGVRKSSLRAGVVCVLACLLCLSAFGREPYHVERKGSCINVFRSSDEKPFAIIGPIAKRLGVNFMASDFDREYGVFVNNMMYAKEKAKYIINLYL